MGYVVLHLDKSPRNESAMTDHIERNVIAPNVDPTRTHLNKELIEFPEGVKDRTEAIQDRIKNAELSRKVGKNQVQVIRFILSGSTEDMLRIQAAGKLDDWCRDSMDWLKKEYGEKNVVAATLHLDEEAPHIHASVVPIVQGERRKKKSNKEQEAPKKQYKKKKADRPRLCADDVMTKEKLSHYQDSYAEAMAKYGLERGIKGSEARHITTSEFYRNQKVESNNLQENIGLLLAIEDAKRLSIEELRQQEIEAERLKNLKEAELKEHIKYLEEEKQDVYERVRDMYDQKDEARDKFLVMNEYVKQKKAELSAVESQLKEVKNDLDPDSIRSDFELACELYTSLKEIVRIAKECISVGFSKDETKQLTQGKTVQFSGELYSEEHKRSFKAENVAARLVTESGNKNRFCLTINGTFIAEWFKNLIRKIETSARNFVAPKQGRGRGIGK